MAATATIVKVRCDSKKQSQYGDNISHEIALSVKYDPQSIYYQVSGGTGITLSTINQEAADMFAVGKDYDIDITPSAERVSLKKDTNG